MDARRTAAPRVRKYCGQNRSPLMALQLTIGLLVALAPLRLATAQRYARPSHSAGTQNFVVFASSPQWAQQVAQAAESYRRDLAIYWLGEELPPWPRRCPLHVTSAPNMPASGETKYQLVRGIAGGWMMSVQGTPQRVLDSVLPHEISHTIFATHFGSMNKYMPRWADEGACTTVEHDSEKRKHRHYLQQFLRSGRGLAFNRMFRLKEYPNDILPLYAQGHSAVQFLLDQGGPQRFMRFIGEGMETENWTQALQSSYAYTSIGQFQTSWNQWLADGSPQNLVSYSPLLKKQQSAVGLASAERPTPNTQPATVSLASGPASKGTSSPSWYQRRLTAVTGQDPPKYDGRPQVAASSSRPRTTPAIHNAQPPATMRMTRPQPAQSVQVQVQDWGQGAPVPGVQATSGAAGPGRLVPLPH